MFSFSSPSTHEKILEVEKGNNGLKEFKFLSYLALGLLVSKMRVKLKSADKQTFSYWKLVFNPSIVNYEIFQTVSPGTNKKIFQTKYCVRHKHIIGFHRRTVLLLGYFPHYNKAEYYLHMNIPAINTTMLTMMETCDSDKFILS